jgi:hypothetical protein
MLVQTLDWLIWTLLETSLASWEHPFWKWQLSLEQLVFWELLYLLLLAFVYLFLFDFDKIFINFTIKIVYKVSFLSKEN